MEMRGTAMNIVTSSNNFLTAIQPATAPSADTPLKVETRVRIPLGPQGAPYSNCPAPHISVHFQC